MTQHCTSTKNVSSSVVAEPTLYLVFDQIRTSQPDHHGILSGWQYETLRSKLLKAGFTPDSVSVHILSDALLAAIPGNRTIVGFGESVLRAFTDKRGIDKWVLSPLKSHLGHNFLPAYDFGRMQKQYELNLYLDLVLRRAFEMTSLTSPWPTTTENFLLNPGVEETLHVLKEIKDRPILAVDVETGYGQINTVGFAWSATDAIAINVLPDRVGDHAYYELWNSIRDALEAPSRKVFQNFIYDVSYFSAYGIRVNNIYHDTMWGMKFLWPELKSNLGNVGRIYTKRPYWKDDGKVTDEEGGKKDWGNVRDWTKHYQYNCLSKDMRVITNRGLLPIRDIARGKQELLVRSWNEAHRCIEWKPITNWLVRKEDKPIKWRRIRLAGMGKGRKGLYVTPDHKILTERGWVEAVDIVVGDNVLTEGVSHNAGTVLGTAWGDSSLSHTTDKSTAYLVCSQINEELIKLKQSLFGGTVTSRIRTTGYGKNKFYDLYVPACPQFAQLKIGSVSDNIHKLTDMGIALWFMDDGCKQKNKYSPTMKLALQSYSTEERTVIWSYFKTRFGSGGSLDKAGNMCLSVPMSRRLCNELGYYFVPSLRYKMSHEGPAFSPVRCVQYISRREVPIEIPVIGVKDEVKKKRGYSTSYCISVKDNENFLTEYGIVRNCRDTTGTYEAHSAQREDLQNRGLLGVFTEYVMELAEPILEMCSTGLPLCLETKARLQSETQAKVEALTKEFHAKVGSALNPGSSKQMIGYLEQNNITVPKVYDSKTGGYRKSVDAKAIKKVMLKHPKLAGLRELQQIKSLSKALSSYLNFDVRSDGKLSYSLNGCGTETLRFSSTSDPWDCGFGPLTIPREGGVVSIKSMFVAPEGYTFIEADLKAAETYYVAYASVCKKLIEMLHSGEDVHKYVAHEIIKALGQPSETYVKKWRDLGKKTGHGANYLMKEGTFVENVFKDMDMILTKKEGKIILESYFGVFPEIHTWHGWVKNELYHKRKLTAPSGWERYFYGRPGDDMLREAVPWAPQHTVPWIINHMMFHLRDERRRGNLEFQLLVQVHDALYLLVPDEWVDRVGRACLDTKSWHPKVILPGGELIIPVEVEIAKCLASKEVFRG